VQLPSHPSEINKGVIAIDIGGTFIRAGWAHLSAGEVSPGVRISTDAMRRNDPVEVLADLIDREVARLRWSPAGVVVGVPGFMDQSQRTVVNAPNVKSLRGMALASLLERKTGLPVWLEHDGALLTRGECESGCAKGAETVLGVYFGTGVGAAYLCHGSPMPPGPFRMQLGHIPVRGEGRVCSCGGIDCVEPYASGLALMEIASQHGVAIGRIFGVSAGNSSLATAIDQFLAAQALAVATAITLFDPEVVVIGGGIPAMKDYPFEALRTEIARRLSPVRSHAGPRIALAELGGAAVFHGAANLVNQHQDVLNRGERSHLAAKVT
jgi:allose kinase